MKKKKPVNLPKGDTVPINPQIEKQARKEEERKLVSKRDSVNEPKTEPAVEAELEIRRKKK